MRIRITLVCYVNDTRWLEFSGSWGTGEPNTTRDEAQGSIRVRRGRRGEKRCLTAVIPGQNKIFLFLFHQKNLATVITLVVTIVVTIVLTINTGFRYYFFVPESFDEKNKNKKNEKDVDYDSMRYSVNSRIKRWIVILLLLIRTDGIVQIYCSLNEQFFFVYLDLFVYLLLSSFFFCISYHIRAYICSICSPIVVNTMILHNI